MVDNDFKERDATNLPTRLKNEVVVARKELKNIRREIFSLKKLQKKEVTRLENLLKSCVESQNQAHDTEQAIEKERCSSPTDKTDIPFYLTNRPIGTLRSVFQFKNGTPRQPGICQYSRGSLTIDKETFNNPEHSLEGLEQFSHIWIIFVFHENNTSGAYTKAKVKPPRLDGAKVGLFSTRSPCRPNPIGLTLAKIEEIEGATIHLSGIDILDGTPVLDIKPYIPGYDCPAGWNVADKVDLNESQLVVDEENLSVIESEIPDILESSTVSSDDIMIGTEHSDSPSKSPIPKAGSETLETHFCKLKLDEPTKSMITVAASSASPEFNNSSILGNLSNLTSPCRDDASVSLNRSLEIVKEALCGSMVSDLNDSIHDPLDPLAIIHSVKQKMKVGKNLSPGVESAAVNDSGLGGSFNTTKASTSGQGYPFETHRSSPGYSPGSSFHFGSSPGVDHSVSSVSDCDRSFEANDPVYRQRRPTNNVIMPDLVFGKPTSQLSPKTMNTNPENQSVSSISDSDETICSNYNDAFLSRSSDSILANQKVTVNASFRCVSPVLKGAGLGTGVVSDGGHPKSFTPIQLSQKKYSPPTCSMSSDPSGHSGRMSPKLRRLYSNLLNSSANTGDHDETENNGDGPSSPEIALPNPDNTTTIADWINVANVKKELLVSFTQRAEKMIQMFGNESKFSPFKLKHLKTWESLRHAIESVLKADPRSVYRRQNCQDRLYYFTVDCAHITCWFDGNHAEVLKVQPMEFASKLKSS